MTIISNAKIERARTFYEGRDYRSSSFPSPKLLNRCRFPGLPPGEVPPANKIPRIVGLYHNSSGYCAALEHLIPLAVGTKVGLELDGLQVLSQHVQAQLHSHCPSFSGLALFARECGLIVRCLEKPRAQYSARSFSLLREIGAVMSALVDATPATPPASKFAEELDALQSRLGPQRGCSLQNPARTSAWRSELMAQNIAQRGDWNDTDVIIVGTAHALNLATIFGTTVSCIIADCENSSQLQTMTGLMMRKQRRDHLWLGIVRRMQRLRHKSAVIRQSSQ